MIDTLTEAGIGGEAVSLTLKHSGASGFKKLAMRT
jgi:hypothetical protein